MDLTYQSFLGVLQARAQGRGSFDDCMLAIEHCQWNQHVVAFSRIRTFYVEKNAEVRFVHAVTASGIVKFLPAV